MKILVIDDEKPTLSMFKLFLTAYGYEVHTAESGEAGMALFRDLDPEIVFTDIRMPGMDGLEVLRQIRASAPRCQVVIITGHGDMERAVEALDLDASDFINKPVERQALNAALIRAEKRVGRGVAAPLAVTPVPAESKVVVQGKLMGSGGDDLRQAVDALEDEDLIEFCLNPDFSIDRKGIALFMEILTGLSQKEKAVRITGLSYNYLRFFEMAGIHKLAGLEAAATEEPGL